MAANVRLLENRWDDAYAAGLDEPGKLLYRSTCSAPTSASPIMAAATPRRRCWKPIR
ncbi:hypothetical protein ACOJBO_44865 [Rhizobium beringeri]